MANMQLLNSYFPKLYELLLDNEKNQESAAVLLVFFLTLITDKVISNVRDKNRGNTLTIVHEGGG